MSNAETFDASPGEATRAARSKARRARVLARARRRVARFFASYVSPLGWFVALSGIACVAVFPATGWHELLAFGAVCLTMTAAAIAMSLGNTAFHASIDVSGRRVSVGDHVDVDVNVANPGRAPTARARADLPIGRVHEAFAIPMLASRQSKHTQIGFTAMSRAVLPIGPLNVRKGDPFGLVRHEKKLAQSVTVFIHPAIVRLDALDAGVARDLEGQPSGQIVDDDLDFYGLREYTPGDDVRNVHWLSTAKTGTLMIRQYEATRRTDTSITLDVAPDDYADENEFELAVSIHASIGVQCIGQDRPLATHAGGKSSHPKTAVGFLDSCSAIEPDVDDDPNLARATIRDTPDASFYYFTVGSLKGTDEIKRIAMALPRSATCVMLRASAGADRAVRRYPDFTLATVGELDDLPMVMEVLA